MTDHGQTTLQQSVLALEAYTRQTLQRILRKKHTVKNLV